jgi:hypothetical protein
VAHELGHLHGLADVNANNNCTSENTLMVRVPVEPWVCYPQECDVVKAMAIYGVGGAGSSGASGDHNPTPILIDVSGNGMRLSDAKNGVMFDIDADGTRELVAWPLRPSENAILVLDRNGSGDIDNGIELFGNLSPQSISSTPNGFIALAEFDDNNDRMIDRDDAVYPQLRLWFDLNRNGFSEPNELVDLRFAGIAAISLDYMESRIHDRYGNEFRYWSYALSNSRERFRVCDVFLDVVYTVETP